MKGNTRILCAVLTLSTITLFFFFARIELSSYRRVKVTETWYREHDGAPNFVQKPHTASDGKAVGAGNVNAKCNETEVEDLSWLKAYKLSPAFQYTSRDIVTVQNATFGRPLVTEMKERLFKDFQTVKLDEDHTLSKKGCLPPLILEVAQGPPAPVDASHIMFGLQTTISRLEDTVKHIARWLPNTGSSLHSIVIESETPPDDPNPKTVLADPFAMGHVEHLFHNYNMNGTVRGPLDPKHSFPQRYFSIVEMLYNARTPKTKWIALIDDDTFFPSMSALVQELARHDDTKGQYIGSQSENWGAVERYHMMAFGGAGIFLSLSTAANMVAHKQDCNEHLDTKEGDVTVRECIHRFSDTKLTVIPALHQVDLLGDVSGFFESGREYLSVHHWKTAPGFAMEKMHLVNDVCGQCFLQRWMFPDEVLLANGFSITRYPLGNLSGNIKKASLLDKLKGGKRDDVKKAEEKEEAQKLSPGDKKAEEEEQAKKEQEEREKKLKEEKQAKEDEERRKKEEAQWDKDLHNTKINLLAVEETWYDGGRFSVDHSIGPARPKLKEDMKDSYHFLDGMVLDDGTVRQVYMKKGAEGKQDEVIVLNWRDGGKAA